MDDNVMDLVHTEVSSPTPRFVRSNGALYALLLFSVFGVIFLGNWLSRTLNINEGYIQIGMYSVLLVVAILVYRFRLTAFRYTITDKALYIDKVTGKREQNLYKLPLRDISAVEQATAKVRAPRTYCGKRASATKVTCLGKVYLISATDSLKEKLVEHTFTAAQ
ncbi:MAG: hypothetical protein PHT58_02890 [Eubacteriales bacterium]|nr:hypothetical protein [Eubacteriales bacterium]